MAQLKFRVWPLPSSLFSTLFIGGSDGEKLLATTELWSNNKWEEHVRLPVPLYGHCMTMINQSHILITGGGTESNNEVGKKKIFLTFILNILENMWLTRTNRICKTVNFGCRIIHIFSVFKGGSPFINLRKFIPSLPCWYS